MSIFLFEHIIILPSFIMQRKKWINPSMSV